MLCFHFFKFILMSGGLIIFSIPVSPICQNCTLATIKIYEWNLIHCSWNILLQASDWHAVLNTMHMQFNSAFTLKWITIFVEEARSALTGFHVDPPSGQIDFVLGGKLGTWRNLLKRSNSQPTYMHGTQNKTQDTLVGGECPYQCYAPSLPPTKLWFF